jgi:hypothetical protein
VDVARLTRGQIIVAVGALVLILSLFLDWVSGIQAPVGVTYPNNGGSAWDVFSVMSIIMLLIGLAALAYVVATTVEAAAQIPAASPWILGALGLIVLGWVLGWDLEVDNAGVGAWLGLLGAAGVTFGALIAAEELGAAAPRLGSFAAGRAGGGEPGAEAGPGEAGGATGATPAGSAGAMPSPAQGGAGGSIAPPGAGTRGAPTVPPGSGTGGAPGGGGGSAPGTPPGTGGPPPPPGAGDPPAPRGAPAPSDEEDPPPGTGPPPPPGV